MTVRKLAGVLAFLLAALSACGGREPVPHSDIFVFAAASLSDALSEVVGVYAKESRTTVLLNFAGSNDLARQIEAGDPAAVFISANRAQIEALEKAGKVRPGTSFPLLGNSLVVIEPREGKPRPVGSARDLLAFDRLSLADPAAVPAGVYAKTWLEHEGVWAQLAPKVVPALDVRAALAAVAAGNLPAGIVYATDAASSYKVRVVYRVPAAATPDLRYFATPVAPESPEAAAFLNFLRSPQARAIFSRYGFIPGG